MNNMDCFAAHVVTIKNQVSNLSLVKTLTNSATFLLP